MPEIKSCKDCRYFTQDLNSYSWGWCKHPERRGEPSSVFPNGFDASVTISFAETCEDKPAGKESQDG